MLRLPSFDIDVDDNGLIARLAHLPHATAPSWSRMNLGSLDWAEATSGKLTRADRRSFLAPAFRQNLAFGVSRLRLALGLRRSDAASIDLEAFEFPDSKLAHEAEAEAQATLSPSTINHSYRSFLYGLALSQLDRVSVDTEHPYATALLHDTAIESPDPPACFALRGARTMQEVARRAGVDEATGRTLAEGIAHHITPGVTDELGPLAALPQAGAMVDLTGQRLWEMRTDFQAAAIAKYPRLDMKRPLGAFWQAEASAFPEGRTAFIERVFLFSLLVRIAPFPE